MRFCPIVNLIDYFQVGKRERPVEGEGRRPRLRRRRRPTSRRRRRSTPRRRRRSSLFDEVGWEKKKKKKIFVETSRFRQPRSLFSFGAEEPRRRKKEEGGGRRRIKFRPAGSPPARLYQCDPGV